MLKRYVPDYDKKPAPDSLQVSVDHWVATKPRGGGHDPITGTYLDKTVPEIVQPLVVGTPKDTLREMIKEHREAAKAVTAQVDKVKEQIKSEVGRLAPPTGDDLGPLNIGLFDK